MNGLERIISAITGDAKKEAEKIVSDALREAESIKSKKISEAKSECEPMKNAARKKADSALQSAEAACEASIKRSVLAAKAEVADECISRALSGFAAADNEKYFGIIYSLISKYAHGEEGEIVLCKKDINRLPADFNEHVNRAAKGNGGRLTVSGDVTDADGGFILRYGEIDENCTFRALADEKMSEIKDELYKMADDIIKKERR